MVPPVRIRHRHVNTTLDGNGHRDSATGGAEG